MDIVLAVGTGTLIKAKCWELDKTPKKIMEIPKATSAVDVLKRIVGEVKFM